MNLFQFVAVLLVGILTFSAKKSSAASIASCRRIDAAVSWHSTKHTYFFSGSDTILYNDHHHAEEDEVPVTSLAPDFPTNIDAAVAWFENDRSFYFKGCHGYMFNETKRTGELVPLQQFGLPCDVDAAEHLNSSVIRVFKGCTYWHLMRGMATAVEAGNMRGLGLPCNVDAAITWDDDNMYIIKEDIVWTPSTTSRPAGARLLDEWNLCSWNICHGNVSNVSLSGQVAEARDVALTCNGDPRLCHLNFDQVTLAGSHNAGSGFDGGFGPLVDCWARNQNLSVLEQLRLGVRYLDVDTSWQPCGLLGTSHNILSGGPVCKMLKEVKQFLQENRQEVVAINFNHEMQDMDRVMPALLRQRVAQFPEYATAKWIHSEDLLKSTWRSDTAVTATDCQAVLRAVDVQCQQKAREPLLEVSVFGSSLICVSSIAKACHPLLHQVARACAHHRHAQNKAPNVLLVDYPEMAASDSQSVVSAAFHQNLRNLAQLSSHVCHVSVDAVTWDGDTNDTYFFSGDRVLTYSWQTGLQKSAGRTSSDLRLPANVDAAFLSTSGLVCVTSGCDVTCRHKLTSGSVNVTNLKDMGLPCHVNAAFTKGNNTFFFKECQYWRSSRNVSDIGPRPVTDFGPLPCNLTAAFVDRNEIHAGTYVSQATVVNQQKVALSRDHENRDVISNSVEPHIYSSTNKSSDVLPEKISRRTAEYPDTDVMEGTESELASYGSTGRTLGEWGYTGSEVTNIKSYIEQTGPANFRIDIQACQGSLKTETISASEGMVEVVVAENNTGALLCLWKIAVPEGKFMTVVFDRYHSGDQLLCKLFFVLSIFGHDQNSIASLCGVSGLLPPVAYSLTNELLFLFSNYWQKMLIAPFEIKFRFNTTVENWRRHLIVVNTTSKSGYVASPGYDGTMEYPNYFNGSAIITPPTGHTVMISFPRIDISYSEGCLFDYLRLTQVDTDIETEVWKKCGDVNITPRVFNSSLRLVFVSDSMSVKTGFKMLFSFHSYVETPEEVDAGVFNCSVRYFHTFKDHVHCNMERECEGGEDEASCPYTNPSCGEGLIDGENKCYRFENKTKNITWKNAFSICHSYGQQLVTLKTPQEWRDFQRILDYGKRSTYLYIGLYGAHVSDLELMYTNVLQWIDGTMAYYIQVEQPLSYIESPVCFVIQYGYTVTLSFVKCHDHYSVKLLCESSKNSKTGGLLRFTTQVLVGNAFNVTPAIESLDVRGCPVESFSQSVLKDLKSLLVMYSDNYKLCCRDVCRNS
ncbi:hypothetical protein C0Q70_11775 [Pomacea canaliculata]|uniref:C-type lectin domain-containing protein n=1 Tax=Pomacea canaliculata TaxID=400727 RepID=A0A2T7P6X7_POMCA|nr:hypothetical protein C0Q70_11775 [Pomacea canaliculata]